MSTAREKPASQRGSERGVEMQSVGLGRHDRGGVGRRVGGGGFGRKRFEVALLFLALPACLGHCTVLCTARPYYSQVLRIRSAGYGVRGRGTSPAGMCEPGVNTFWSVDIRTVFYCVPLPLLVLPWEPKQGLCSGCGWSQRERERENACWLRPRQFNQGPATATSASWELGDGAGAFAVTAERGDFMQGTAAAEQPARLPTSVPKCAAYRSMYE